MEYSKDDLDRAAARFRDDERALYRPAPNGAGGRIRIYSDLEHAEKMGVLTARFSVVAEETVAAADRAVQAAAAEVLALAPEGDDPLTRLDSAARADVAALTVTLAAQIPDLPLDHLAARLRTASRTNDKALQYAYAQAASKRVATERAALIGVPVDVAKTTAEKLRTIDELVAGLRASLSDPSLPGRRSHAEERLRVAEETCAHVRRVRGEVQGRDGRAQQQQGDLLRRVF